MGWNEDVKKIVEFIPRFESMRKEMVAMDKENSRINKLIDSYSASLNDISMKIDGIYKATKNTNKRIDELEKQQGYDDSHLKQELTNKVLSVKKDIETSISSLKHEVGEIQPPSEYDDSKLNKEIQRVSKEVEDLIHAEKAKSNSSELEAIETCNKINSIESALKQINESIKNKQEKTEALESTDEILEKINSIKLNVEKSLKSFGAVEISSIRKEMAEISRELETLKNEGSIHHAEHPSSDQKFIIESINNTNERIDELEKQQGYDDSPLRGDITKELDSIKNDLEGSILKLSKEINSIETPESYDDSILVERINNFNQEIENLEFRIDRAEEKSETLSRSEELSSLESRVKEFTSSIKSNVEKSLKSFGAVEISSIRKEMAEISRELETLKNGEH